MRMHLLIWLASLVMASLVMASESNEAQDWVQQDLKELGLSFSRPKNFELNTLPYDRYEIGNYYKGGVKFSFYSKKAFALDKYEFSFSKWLCDMVINADGECGISCLGFKSAPLKTPISQTELVTFETKKACKKKHERQILVYFPWKAGYVVFTPGAQSVPMGFQAADSLNDRDKRILDSLHPLKEDPRH